MKHTIPVARLLESVSPAYGGANWSEALDTLLADSWDRRLIDDLAGELQQAGRFQHEVVIEWDEETTADRIADGMHRVAAAALIGAPIEVRRGYPVEADDEFVRVLFRLSLPTLLTSEGLFDGALGLLRSFRLPGGPWVVSDYCSGRSPEFEFIWACPHRITAALAVALQERVHSAGGSIEIIEVGPETFSDADQLMR